MSPSYGVELFTPAARQRITRSLREKGGYQDILGSGDDADGFCLSDEEFLEIIQPFSYFILFKLIFILKL